MAPRQTLATNAHACKGEYGKRRDCASPKLGALATQNSPLDCFAGYAGSRLYGAYSTLVRARVKTRVWSGGMTPSPAPSLP